MNYKEMLDQFEFLNKKLSHLELENRHLKERVAKLEANHWFNKPQGPQFTPGTLPQYQYGPSPNYTVTCDGTGSQAGVH